MGKGLSFYREAEECQVLLEAGIVLTERNHSRNSCYHKSSKGKTLRGGVITEEMPQLSVSS
jgi:hypothetical protein